MRFTSAMCRLSQKVPKFLSTTALQRKLIVGALDFSPLRHSPAFTRQESYTKTPSERSGEILANVNRSEAAGSD